ncbi:CPBP family intramembrane glutamic endopeptidase [Nocardia aurea]|uniref:CPBP family intramembrane glutamic endopeptidase n=1 Tax=Nocardia aurea TaxID=2144174 RepID=A0ABV3FPC9_9NOCA
MTSVKVVAAVVVPLAWNNILLPRLRLGLRGRTVAHAAFATGYSVALRGNPRWRSARGARYGLVGFAAVSSGYVVALTVPPIRHLLAGFADRSRTVGDPAVAESVDQGGVRVGDGSSAGDRSEGDPTARIGSGVSSIRRPRGALDRDSAADDFESAVVDPVERVAVHIPIGTVYSEEMIFRATLDPLLDSVFGRRIGPLAAAAVFGLWHIHPARVAGDNVPATVAATTVGGLLFGLLARRAASATAPALLHFALNSGGVIAPLLAERGRPV